MLQAAQLPLGVTHSMVDRLIIAGERAGLRILEDAQHSVPWPKQLPTKTQREHHSRRESRPLFLAREQGVNLFRTTPLSSQPPQGLAQSLWCKMRDLGRPSATKTTGKTTSRVFGTSYLFASLEQFITMLGPRDPSAPALLYPGASQMRYIHMLFESGHDHVCLRAITMPKGAEATKRTQESRDFLVVEYRNKFQLSSEGRNAYVVVYHSVSWSRPPSASSHDAVQGSVYVSGVVAIESESVAGRLELYGVAEINLKGLATVHENGAAACRYAKNMLSEITTTIENRAMETLALDAPNVFDFAHRASIHHHQHETCSACERFLDQGDRPVACRKCYAVVCGDCSCVYRFGRQEVRLCIACWHNAHEVVSK